MKICRHMLVCQNHARGKIPYALDCGDHRAPVILYFFCLFLDIKSMPHGHLRFTTRTVGVLAAGASPRRAWFTQWGCITTPALPFPRPSTSRTTSILATPQTFQTRTFSWDWTIAASTTGYKNGILLPNTHNTVSHVLSLDWMNLTKIGSWEHEFPDL